MIAYENLDLRIQADGDTFAVVAQRGTQSVSGPFGPLPSHSWDLEKLERQGPEVIKRRGSDLFNALFQGEVRNMYQQSRGSVGSDAGRGFRIRILLDLRDPRVRPFMQIPWEILFDPNADASQLLALDSRRAIVRMIDSNEPHVDPPSGPLKRILLVSANPVDTDRLQLDVERRRVEEVLSRYGLQPDVLRGATRSTLLDHIQNCVPQIVHFMGHGSLIDGEGVLLLEGRKRARDPLPASAFASFCTGRSVPRLVILNSCRTAAVGRARTFQAFASVAAALSAAGVPAVIAMQSTIRDTSAIRFMERLYEGLLRNAPIEAALADARSSLSAIDRYMLDWAAPVLYLRAHAGGITDTKDTEVSARPQPSQPPSSTIIQSNNGVVVISSTVSSLTQQGDRRS